MKKLKTVAAQRGVPMRAILEQALQHYLSSAAQGQGKFTLKKGAFKGKGLQAGVSLANWSEVAKLVYEGRGA
jgi:hypothetical protein